MSVNPNGMDEPDYSDFEYQTNVTQIIAREADDTTGNEAPSVVAQTSFEPLSAVGGLDNNEVAELVYLETQADIEFLDEAADQDVATTAKLRGVVGLNLADSVSSLPENRNTDSSQSLISTDNIDPANVELNGRGGSDDRWLQPFVANAAPPFDDQTNGPGGVSSGDAFYAEKNYRQLTGRGPVVDSNDDLTVVANLSSDDIIINFTGDIRTHIVWDVAETSDAGRRFSVPMDD